VIAVVHAKHPFLLTGVARALALSEPVHVARSLPARKIEGIGPDPRRNGELAGCGDAVVGFAWDLDKVVHSVELKIDVARAGR
jgi:hypothetical protein